MNQTIFENLPQKMNLISDLFSRVVFRDKEACHHPHRRTRPGRSVLTALFEARHGAARLAGRAH